ncbi:MAG: hypothetical protein QOE33_3782 [Acidobacteriota bacterium]|nr:hypothetical protein [Acidobacteriota bacterium]
MKTKALRSLEERGEWAEEVVVAVVPHHARPAFARGRRW